jgi:hypothetical protein
VRFRLPSWFLDFEEARNHPIGIRILNFSGYFLISLLCSAISGFLFANWLASLIVSAIVGLVMMLAFDLIHGMSTWPRVPESQLARILWVVVSLLALGTALAFGTTGFIAGLVMIVVAAIVTAVFSKERR